MPINAHQFQGQPDFSRRTVGYDSQYPQVVGRPLQEHELPPEVRRALMNEGQIPAQIITRPLGEGQIPPQLASRGAGETQLPPQFVGRTVNETYLSPRTLPQGYVPQQQQGSMGRGSVPISQGGLSFFQNMVDPQGVKGGRIE